MRKVLLFVLGNIELCVIILIVGILGLTAMIGNGSDSINKNNVETMTDYYVERSVESFDSMEEDVYDLIDAYYNNQEEI